MMSEEKSFELHQGNLQQLNTCPELAELVEAETAFHKLQSDFNRASLQAVHQVVKKNPAPLNLFNIYGDDGDKYIVGGILVRRAKGWTICGSTLSDSSILSSTEPSATSDPSSSPSIAELSGKVAALDVRNLALLRNRIEGLVVPLACFVDYYGIKFETQSLAPLSINSIVYGSDTDGLLFTDEDVKGEKMAQ